MNPQTNTPRQSFIDQEAIRGGFASQLMVMVHVLHDARERNMLIWLGAGLIVVIGATAYGQIELNAWNRPFYNALSHKDLPGFGLQLVNFALIAGTLLILNVAQTWLNQMARMKLREALTRDLFRQWLTPRRAFMLAGVGPIGVNPDQRIYEDAHHLAELSTDLGVGLLQAALLLVSFIGVLWGLSAGVTFELDGKSFAIPGYMVWCALFYAGVGSLASWAVGRRLIHLDAERYARESNLRFALVHDNEHSEGIAVYRGEAEEVALLNQELDRLLIILRQLVRATTNLTWITAGYGWFTIVAPIIVAAPAYFGGDLSFGGLMMAAGAFTQVQQSLRWFVDNTGAIADWRATLLRVAGFRQALLKIDKIGEGISHVELVSAADDKLALEGLEISLPSGSIGLSEVHVEIAPGDHVLVVGAPGSGKTSLFRALAGLWRWGSGKISLPPAEGIMFMPKRAYIPTGALRDILAYPASPGKFKEQDFVAALTRMGLSHLCSQLDRVARWDHELTDPEQQGLAFARLLLHKPRWVLIDEAIDLLAPSARKTLLQLFDQELAATTLIYISGPEAEDEFYTRVLRLTWTPQGQLLPAPGASASLPPEKIGH